MVPEASDSQAQLLGSLQGGRCQSDVGGTSCNQAGRCLKSSNALPGGLFSVECLLLMDGIGGGKMERAAE